jgi:hypothetical protein
MVADVRPDEPAGIGDPLMGTVAPPKRRRRTKAELEAARAVDTTPGEPTRSPRSMLPEIQMGIALMQTVLAIVPATRADVLSQEEFEALAVGVDEAQKSDRRIRKYVKYLSKGKGYMALSQAIGVILFERLRRRGLLPWWIAGTEAPAPPEETAPPPVAPWPSMNGAGPYEPEVSPNGVVSVPPVYAPRDGGYHPGAAG